MLDIFNRLITLLNHTITVIAMPKKNQLHLPVLHGYSDKLCILQEVTEEKKT